MFSRRILQIRHIIVYRILYCWARFISLYIKYFILLPYIIIRYTLIRRLAFSRYSLCPVTTSWSAIVAQSRRPEKSNPPVKALCIYTPHKLIIFTTHSYTNTLKIINNFTNSRIGEHTAQL